MVPFKLMVYVEESDSYVPGGTRSPPAPAR